MKILNTARLVIEHVSIKDADFILALVNSPNWIEFIGDRGIKTTEAALAYIQNSLISSNNKNGYGLYKMSLKNSGIPIGICGFLKRDYLKETDIGFAILPTYEEKGYTFEAAQAILNYGIASLGLTTILAITSPKNIKSQKLLQKLQLREIKNIQAKEDGEVLLLFSN